MIKYLSIGASRIGSLGTAESYDYKLAKRKGGNFYIGITPKKE